MSLVDNGGMYMPVAPAGYGNGFGGFGDGSQIEKEIRRIRRGE